MKGASVYPMALARPLSAYTTAMAAVARKHAGNTDSNHAAIWGS